jgi:hypothetical protein
LKITFYNRFHRGDIHFSRSFVEHTIRSLHDIRDDIEFSYVHANSADAMSDIPNLLIETPNQTISSDPRSTAGIRSDCWRHDAWPDKNMITAHRSNENGELSLAINTWVASNDQIFRSNCGTCFAGNLVMWQMIWKILDNDHGLKVTPPENPYDLLPKINYDHYDHCSFVDDHIKNTDGKYRKRIFVSNGPVLSGQAINFDFDPIIGKVVEENPDCVFYLTDITSLEAPNIYSTRRLINKDGCDLNENSYLSTFCDVIIGRASGPFSYACCYDNFMDENKKFCLFANGLENGVWFSGGKCKYEWCLSQDIVQVENIIRTSIGE